jgi:ribosome-associated protein
MEQQTSKKVEKIGGLEKAMLCAEVAAAHKAERPLIWEVNEIVGYADYFVICSGRSTRHVQAIAEHIEAALSQRRVKPLGIEGLLEGHWVLLDLNDVVVHIFYHPVRAFYDLEGLWWEARQVDFSETGDSEQ